MTRIALIQRELWMYLAEDVHPEEDHLSLAGFLWAKSKVGLCATTGETIAEGAMPYLALIARL